MNPILSARRQLPEPSTAVIAALLLVTLLSIPAALAQTSPSISFTLKTALAEGRLVYVGQGGSIDGVVNPDLVVQPNDIVEVTLVNGDGAEHDIFFPEQNAAADHVFSKGESTTISFKADKQGEFAYYCTLPGHRQAGMEGHLLVGATNNRSAPAGVSISRDPTDLPESIGDRQPTTVRVELQATELEGKLADGTSYTYWTFDGQVPGPFLRARFGDVVEVTLDNPVSSSMTHSIDLHAATGPGGGSSVMQVPPGEKKTFNFRALNPGLFVYHCATPMVAQHIANGMYGLILVEPEGGLPPVDKEFYIMQGEIYSEQAFAQPGHLDFSIDKLLAETPEYLIFNGSVQALKSEFPLHANVGDTVRIYLGVGGPNLISSFHVIGEIFDRVYDQASLTAPPLTDLQTTLVPAGGASVIEFAVQVPGRYILVDHALSRMERGLSGILMVDGPDNGYIFKEGRAP